MSIYSLSHSVQGLQVVEVEVQLVRGLPSLQILGRPDGAIKECALRLKTAFQNAGWEWPRNQQIVVNLKPAHLRKESSGLDLAIAFGIRVAQEELDVTKQFGSPDIIAFGEVDLQGHISAPKELQYWQFSASPLVVTGSCDYHLPFDTVEIPSLAQLMEGVKRSARPYQDFLKPPQLKNCMFSPRAAELLEVAGAGEHNLLLAGPAGSGKTTWAEALYTMTPPPYEKEFLRARVFHLKQKRELTWRPFVQPHHSASNISLVGGGVPPRPGAFSFAHGGILLLDEYLEFSREIQEALREPMEKAEIHLFRGTEMVAYPCRFQLIATTNLCPCGDFEPGKVVNCPSSLRRCRSVLERLSGPVVDRFDILHFTSGWGHKEVTTEQIAKGIKTAVEFRKSRGQIFPNSLLSLNRLLEEIPEGLRPFLPEQGGSQRRLRALLRVARTFADLKRKPNIGVEEINQSMELTWSPFEQLKQC